jgi:hypothetical protein
MDIRDIYEAHNEAYERGQLPIYTIFDSPLDHPGKFVVRMSLVGGLGAPPEPIVTNVMVIVDTLEQARKVLEPCGLVCKPRAKRDPRQIVETWF